MDRFIKFINDMSKTTLGTLCVVFGVFSIFCIVITLCVNMSNSHNQVVTSNIHYRIIKCDDTHYMYVPNDKNAEPKMFTIEQTDSIINNSK